MAPELSIIVPVYNVEHYLPQCIESILNQTFTDFELILIDDGSPDRCPQICDKYAQKDRRIVVIHQENAGVSAARNAGVKIAKGKYIGFVDSDDWIEAEMYENMMQVAIQDSLDVVVCGVRKEGDSLPNLNPNISQQNTTYCSNEDLLYDLFSRPSHNLGVIWNKIFNRQLVIGTPFLETLRVWEDLVFLVRIYIGNVTCAVIPKTYYHYRIRSDSATGEQAFQKFDKRAFKKYIFKDVKNYAPKYCGLAISFFLDSIIVLIRGWRSNKMMSCRDKFLMIGKAKWSMLCYIICSRFRGYISQTIFNRFLLEGVIHA